MPNYSNFLLPFFLLLLPLGRPFLFTYPQAFFICILFIHLGKAEFAIYVIALYISSDF